MSDTDGRKASLQQASMGRPFQLGMLYDCRNDTIVPGLSLWDKDTIKKATHSVPKQSSKVNLITGDDLDSKTFHMGASAEIKLSFMSGMVEVQGSAEFLMDNKKSTHHSRISLQYQSTSRFDQLLISDELQDKIKMDKLEDMAATHVVTGIVYGADAYFVFDRNGKEDRDKLKVAGKLEASIKKMPDIGIGGSVSGSFEKEDIDRINELECTFHGDVILNPLPTNYTEAMEAYKKLTHLVGGGTERDYSVPMTVWLLPLSALSIEGPKYVKNISDAVLTRAQKALEALDKVKISATYLLDTLDESPFFDCIRQHLKTFLSLISKRKITFATKLNALLPLLRGDIRANQQDLVDLLNSMTCSPYDAEGLYSWIDDRENEAQTLKELLEIVKDKKNIELAMRPGDLNKAIINSSKAHLLVLVASTPVSDLYIKQMELDKEVVNKRDDHWFENPLTVVEMRNEFRSFTEFAAISDPKEVKCIVAHFKEYSGNTCKTNNSDQKKNVTIALFLNGEDEPNTDYFIPSKPRAVKATSDPKLHCACVKLEWKQPLVGKEQIESYQVTYHMTDEETTDENNTTDEKRKILTKMADKAANSTVIRKLKQDATFEFTVQAECKAGLCEKSETIKQ